MAIEPVNERPIFPALIRADSAGVGTWSVSMIRQLTTVFQQYGYRLNAALLEEMLASEGGTILEIDNLAANGGTILEIDNLAANGGTIAEIDEAQTWTATQTFTPAQVFSAVPTAIGHPLRFDELAANGGSIPETDESNTFAGTQTVVNPVTLQGESWTAPTLLNGWVNYGLDYSPAQYRKLPSGLVTVQGLIKNGTATNGTVLFTLSAGYRPDARLIVTTLSNNALARIDIKNTGDVTVQAGGSATWLSITCSFFASQ